MIKTRNAHSQLLKEIYIKIIAKIFFHELSGFVYYKIDNIIYTTFPQRTHPNGE